MQNIMCAEVISLADALMRMGDQNHWSADITNEHAFTSRADIIATCTSGYALTSRCHAQGHTGAPIPVHVVHTTAIPQCGCGCVHVSAYAVCTTTVLRALVGVMYMVHTAMYRYADAPLCMH